MTPRLVSLALALAAVFSLPPQAQAQISPGFHVARAADSFGGVNGVGGSLQLSLPVLPVDLFFAGAGREFDALILFDTVSAASYPAR